MKLKNYNSVLGAGLLSASCVFGIVSCDGGGSDSVIVENQIDIPDVPNAANDEVTGDDADGTGADVDLEETYNTQVFDGINDERTSRGLTVLTLDSELSELAEAHNLEMMDRADVGGSIQIDHIGAQERADIAFARGAVAYAENIAGVRGYGSSEVADTFVDGWVNSAGHFENLTGDYTSTGVAVTVDERDGTIYATQVFVR